MTTFGGSGPIGGHDGSSPNRRQWGFKVGETTPNSGAGGSTATPSKNRYRYLVMKDQVESIAEKLQMPACFFLFFFFPTIKLCNDRQGPNTIKTC